MFLAKFIALRSRFYHWLMPRLCVLCGNLAQQELNLCQPCQQNLPILPDSCPQCAQFLAAKLNSRCGACLSHSPPFDRTFALFPYAPPIIPLIIQLKFQHQLSIAETFGTLFVQRIRHTWYVNRPLPDLILPLPLHKERLRERGFNQAVEIAKPIAKALRLPLDTQGIKRAKATLAQSGLSAAKRKQNMSHAFIALRPYTGLSLAVLDDVITTGHTMTAICRLLKQQGAKNIDVWCCARA
jgi:ComF family protein